MEEEWIDIDGFDNYQVSTNGRIRNKVNNKILKPNTDSGGYSQVGLYKNGIRYTVLLHKIVATSFITNDQGFKEIDHKNRNKLDNSVQNLRWCSRSDNMINTEHRNSEMFGIRYRKERNTWRVIIPIDGKLRCIGSRKTREEAIQLRNTFFKTNDK
jgi:NUMOD4 motif/HNH endonuclease